MLCSVSQQKATEGNPDRKQNKNGKKMHRAKFMNPNNFEAITKNQLYNTKIKD